jgi:hypothetical protein
MGECCVKDRVGWGGIGLCEVEVELEEDVRPKEGRKMGCLLGSRGFRLDLSVLGWEPG